MTDTAEQLMATLHEWTRIFVRRSMLSLLLYAKDKQLSKTQIGALMVMHRLGPCSVSDLGEKLHISGAAASQMLERLVQQGIVERTEDPSDRRMKIISLTDKGQKLLQEGHEAHKRWLADYTSHLTPAEQIQVTAALQLLLDRAQEPGELDHDLYPE